MKSEMDDRYTPPPPNNWLVPKELTLEDKAVIRKSLSILFDTLNAHVPMDNNPEVDGAFHVLYVATQMLCITRL